MERIKKLQTPLIIFLIILIVFLGWWLLRRYQVGFNHNLSASGMVEATEISIAPEISGKVAQVLVDEGQSVKAGDILFILDDALLSAQRQKANAAVQAAQANLQVAQSGLAAANTNLELAQANDDLAQTQYQLTAENVRRADEKHRAAYWRQLVPYQFNLPVWYFAKEEQIKAAEAEVEAAKSALEQEKTNYFTILKQSGYEELLNAEERLARARIAFEVANEVLNRAKAANDDDGNGKDDEEETQLETWVVPSSSGGYQTKNLPITYSLPNDHWDNETFEAAEDALQDTAQAASDKAKAELDAAQQEYKKLLATLKLTQDIQNARARLAVATERYELAQDKLMELHSGSDSLQLIAAQDMVRQAEASLKQAKDGVSQAKAKVEQAQAALNQAQADLEYIDTQIKRLTIIAPSDGVILNRSIEVGEVIQAGAPALTLANLGKLTLTVYVPEDQYGQITIGMAAKVTADSFPGEVFQASVYHIADQAEFTPRNVQTKEGRRTTFYAIDLNITNVDNQLKPGMPVDVQFVEQ